MEPSGRARRRTGGISRKERRMAEVTYHVVQHDGGWTYKVGEVFAETFKTREQAEVAARRAAAEQRLSNEPAEIEYEDERGEWHEEHSDGDPPDTKVD
jgi:hypothetical protein